MRSRRMIGTTLLAVGILAAAWGLSLAQVGAQAVSSLPLSLYQGDCSGETATFVTDLQPIVPAASSGTFAGSDLAIDVASSVSTLQVDFNQLMSTVPLALIVTTGTGADAVALSCGVVGGFVNDGTVTFGIDDVNDSGVSGIGVITNDGTSVTITVILGEFPVGDAAATGGASTSGSTACDGVEVPLVTSPHGVAIAGDADGDSLTDTEEATLGTDPNNADTDGDGIMDGFEASFSQTDPLDTDSFPIDADLDGLPAELETSFGTDPNNVDSDNDGIADGWEFFLGNNPLDPNIPADTGTDTSVDPDQDGLSTRTELEMGTDPANPDTDFDGVSDGAEVTAGTSPRSASC